jgi:hypothetical protein
MTAMFDVHITFPLAQFHAMVSAFEGQFEAQQKEVAILDFGCSYKQERGYIVLEWEDEVDPTFIDQLYADSNVLDFSVYCIPCITDDQLSALEVV